MTESLIKSYRETRSKTNELVAPLEIEDFTIQPIMDVSPPKWHLGHTTWFFETFILNQYNPKYTLYCEKFPRIFNSYYKSMGPHWIQANRGHLSRPTVKEVFSYRKSVDEKLISFLEVTKNPLVEKLLKIGIEHEKQHQELLLMDIKYIFAVNELNLQYSHKSLRKELPNTPLEYQDIPGGLVEIGAQNEEFAYDNESPLHQTHLLPFKIANRPISNGDYLEFINDGGYSNPDFWLSDGFNSNFHAPLYWKKINNQWYEYDFSGWEPLNLKKPLGHVSYYEADAFAHWADQRLPTEFEWEFAKRTLKTALQSSHWEWTSSSYLPYPKYRREKGPLGEYNGKFMCGQKVLRGESFATPNQHSRPSYRNFYHPEKRWHFCGIRLAKDG
jgi:ergothioneine biosynthesis protein EgtB